MRLSLSFRAPPLTIAGAIQSAGMLEAREQPVVSGRG